MLHNKRSRLGTNYTDCTDVSLHFLYFVPNSFYKPSNMLIYNTTYQTALADARNFVIWLCEYYIPEVEKLDMLHQPRLTQILSHKEADTECFSLQWEVEDSATLHRWHTQQGAQLNEEMMKVFKDKIVGFPTLMEVIK